MYVYVVYRRTLAQDVCSATAAASTAAFNALHVTSTHDEHEHAPRTQMATVAATSARVRHRVICDFS